MTTGGGNPSTWAAADDESWPSVADAPTTARAVAEDSAMALSEMELGADDAEASPPEDGHTHPARLALGIAVLAAERLRPGAPTSEAFVTGVGLLQQGAAEARTLARRVMGPPTRMASRTVGWASGLPGSERPRRSFSRSRELLNRVVSEAKKRGEATVAAGRADASAFVQASVTDGIAWAQAQAVPQIVDGMLPHLMDDVVPRLIDGVMPEIRARVLPAVIDDLTHDPRLRDLLMEQSKGAVGEATQHLRATTATADDRVESAFRRRGRNTPPTDRTDSNVIDEANARTNDR